jgi:hypothetical protein
VTAPLDDGIDAPVQAAFDEAAAAMPEPPKLAIVFPPLIMEYAGDAYVNAWEKAARGRSQRIDVRGAPHYLTQDSDMTRTVADALRNWVNELGE